MSERLHLTVVCSGNICCSPIAEKMFAEQIQKRGLTHAVRVSSADHMSADLIIALGRNHVRMPADLRLASDRIRMLGSFDPRSGGHPLDVEDPYYGEQSDFEDVYRVIEAALRRRHECVDQQLARPGLAS